MARQLKPLKQLAKEACELHTEPQAAIRHVRDLVYGDPPMVEMVLDDAVKAAISMAVYQRRAQELSAVKYGRPGKAARDPAALAHLEMSLGESLLEQWTPGGIRLGDCFGRDLAKLIADTRSVGLGYMRNAAFYEALMRKTTPNKTVRSCVKPGQAAKLWQNIAKVMPAEAG